MELLLFKAFQSGRGMSWDETITYIRDLHGVMALGGAKVTVVSGQCTSKQAKIDLANTWEYCKAHTLKHMARAEGWLKALVIDKVK